MAEQVQIPVQESVDPKKTGRSQSIQCSADGSEECGTKMIAHGKTLYEGEHSLSLDSGMMRNLTTQAQIEAALVNFREEIDKEIKKLEETSRELKRKTEENEKLKQELDAERKEKEKKSEKVKELEEEKSKLEETIQQLRDEVSHLKQKIDITMNHSQQLQKQLDAMQPKERKPLNENEDLVERLENLCATIKGALQKEDQCSKSQKGVQAEQDMKSMIVKMSDVKQEYKNGNGGREATNVNMKSNGSHHPPISDQAAAEQNNN